MFDLPISIHDLICINEFVNVKLTTNLLLLVRNVLCLIYKTNIREFPAREMKDRNTTIIPIKVPTLGSIGPKVNTSRGVYSIMEGLNFRRNSRVTLVVFDILQGTKEQ